MEERKIQSKTRYLLAFVIGTVAFIIVFLISNGISFLELQRVSNLQDTLAYGIFEDKIDSSFFNHSICSNESLNQISQDLSFQGKIIDDLEKKFGKDDTSVLERKKFYTLVELEHFEFIQSRIKDCGDNVNTILFFYSNNDKSIDRSVEIGKLLDQVYAKNNNLVIYSFDVNLNSTLMQNLLQKYSIKSSPTLVINDNSTITEPIRIENVEKSLI